MDNNIKITRLNPRTKANIFSKLFFTWLITLCKESNKESLKLKDLYENESSDKSEKLSNKLEKYWNVEIEEAKVKNTKPSLLVAIRKTFFLRYMWCGLFLFIQHAIISTLQPIILSVFIALFAVDSNENSLGELCLYGGIIIIVTFIQLFFRHHTLLMLGREGMRIRIACCSLIYKKLFRLNQESLGKSSAGQLVNLLFNDVNRFDLISQLLHFFWIVPIQLVLVTYLIWREVDVAAIIGVGFLIILTIPVYISVGKLTSVFRLILANRTDIRVKKMAEIVSGIRVIKMYAWEIPFALVVNLVRKREIKMLTWLSYIKGGIISSAVFVGRTILFVTMIAYALLGNTITADKVFSIAQFFNLLQLSMAIYFPQAVSIGAETLVTVSRLENFLLLHEKGDAKLTKDESKGISFKNVKASWVSDVFLFKELTLNILPGSLCAVIGPVGCGKSSLLHLLLGELTCDSGAITIGGNISYSSQEAWLFASTVRKNILFGQKYEKKLYNDVVKVCALERDFELFPDGDQTRVGDRGVSLSGGQKARINLARAVYRSADIYLLDDPLSAVDTRVGKQLFNDCIVEYLNKKTRILVTHQLQFLKKADHIVIINEGRIKAQGTFEELSKLDLEFTKMLVASDENSEIRKDESIAKSFINKRPSLEDKIERNFLRTSSVRSTVSIDASEIHEIVIVSEEEPTNKYGAAAYTEYAKAGGSVWVLMGLVVLLVGGQIISNLTDLWLTYWTEQEAIRVSEERCLTHVNNGKPLNRTFDMIQRFVKSSDSFNLNKLEPGCENDIISTNFSIYVYSGLILACIILLTMRSLVFYKVAMTASQNLHNEMFTSLLHAPMRFFDTNPSGRILNRFSRDMGVIDEMLPQMMLEALQVFLAMAGILIMILITNFYMLAILAILSVVFYKLLRWYITVARDVKHLEGTSKSPVFSHLNASFNGIVTIRSSNCEKILIREFDLHQDTHTSSWYIFLAIIAAFGLWLDFLSSIFLTFIIISFIIIHQFGVVSGSLVGLALWQSLNLTGTVQYGIRQAAEVISQMTSVERVLDYTRLEKEESEESKNRSPLESRPTSVGKIEFLGVNLRYAEDEPLVLKNLTFNINSGEKIGIVGRTGAGKSSLISALFRLAPFDGSIKMDDIDTKTMSLDNLRKKISIIPQEPVLFSATLRYNLDPFQEFSDAALWTALEEVELKEVPSLEFLVQEGGSNFSEGERQLICLARAILRNNKILVLDEATANVDPQTDELIQKAIRTKFKECTLLTIAHRLHTIMDGTKVLVMDAGRLVEYDHPHVLLQNRNGYLFKMVEQTGQSMADNLHSIAQRTYELERKTI